MTVVFAQTQDISSLLLEAYRQRYAGEWIVGDSVLESLSTIVKILSKHLDERAVNELLRGTFQLLQFTHILNRIGLLQASTQRITKYTPLDIVRIYRYIYVDSWPNKK